ncbi:MAG: hypothetical protein FWG82_02630 [Oscillospiraceae bacterium]|nr:hypothetical protein [Oscillospiraceae bacterium]
MTHSENVKPWYGFEEYSVDSQKRLAFPKALKPVLSESFVVWKPLSQKDGALPFLNVYTLDDFNAYQHTIRLCCKEAGMEGYEIDEVIGALNDGAETVTLDSTGRISLRPELREYAKLDKTKKFIVRGRGTRFQLWNPENFAAVKAKALSDKAKDVVSRISLDD